MSDLIDRQELLKHKGNCYDEEGHLLYAVGTGTILLMPTVDAEPVRHGHWINENLNGYQYWKSTCSKCGWYGYSNYDSYVDIYDFAYCPNCGAKMDEEEK